MISRDYLQHQAEGKRFAPAEDPAQAMTGTGIMASQAAGLCTIRYIPIGNLMIFPSAYALPGRKVSAFRRAVLSAKAAGRGDQHAARRRREQVTNAERRSP